jgi:1A family penicillin-binding protein
MYPQGKPHKRRTSYGLRIARRIILIGAIVLLFFLGITAAWAVVMPIPAIDNFESRAVAQSTKIYDRTGSIVLYDVHGSVRRTAVPLDQISPFVRNATIAIEDSSFYTNSGFRPLSLLRAVVADIFAGGYAQGGSTITQQVVKNALLTTNKTIERKLQEIVLALRLTRSYSKDQILQTYLNEIPYGGTIYGIQEASQYFFGVDAKDLDLAQAAYLAAIPQAPTYYSPYGTHRDGLDTRKNLVLLRMKANKFITDEQYAQAKKEKVEFRSEQEAGIKAPHFVFYIREYLEQKYGVDEVNNDGLRVITTLDYDLQQKAEDVLLRGATKNEKTFNASNAGLVAIDPKTGQILSMVGSRNYFDEKVDGAVNVTLALRQPGSSFKPFVYATAFEKGYTPDTVVFDVQTQFSTACQPQDVANDTPPCYSPSNYDGTFKGPITFRNALAISENVPAVKALYLAGIDDSIKTAQDLGISTLADADRYGLTLVLGGGEVTLLDMTGAYSVFANDGIKNPPTGILRVEDQKGHVLEEYSDQNSRVLDQQIARQINDILSDNAARTPEFGADSPLNFPNADVADKTGTTNDFRDTWIIGYTPSIAVGTWAGNNDNTPMQKKIAAFIVAPMWHEFMEYAIQKYPAEPFPAPAPDPTLESASPILRGTWNVDSSKGVHDILYWVDKNNPRNSNPHPWSDGQAAYWDYGVQLWARGEAILITPAPAYTAPSAPKQAFHITTPQEGTTIPSSNRFNLSVYYPYPENVRYVTYYVNGEKVGSSAVTPSFDFSYWANGSRGPSILRAVVSLRNGTQEEQTISFALQ